MDIEQLKLILEAAAAAGGGATKVVFVWFAYKFFGLLIHYGLFAGLFFAAFKIADRCVRSFAFTERIAAILDESYFSSNRKDKFLKWVQKEYPRANDS